MFKKLAILACAVVLLQSNSAGIQESSRLLPLTNADILDLIKAGLSAEIVVAKIRVSPCNFDTSPDALKQLKLLGVPDNVILAMVQAPITARQEKAEENEVSRTPDSTRTSPASSDPIGYVKCTTGSREMHLLESPPANPRVVAKVACMERVTLLSFGGGFFKVRTKSGVEGYISQWSVQEATTRWSPGSAPTSSGSLSEGLVDPLRSNTVRALGYRVVPQQTTTYYRSGGYSSHTSCYGNGTWTTLGSFGSINLNTDCDTTYSSPTDIPITWQFADVYNLVESSNKTYVLHCRANWRWSKCSPLIPGEVFEAEVKGGYLWVTGSRDGKKKIEVKFDILQVTPK